MPNNTTTTYRISPLIFLIVAGGLVFSVLALQVATNGPVVGFDQWVNEHVVALRRPWFTVAMIVITNVISTVTLPIFALILALWFLRQKQKHALALTTLALGGGLALKIIFKELFARARPTLMLVSENSFSFPSGHATLSIIFFLLLIVCFSGAIQSRVRRQFFIAANVLAFVLVGFSRIYLGAHWFSDVLAGFSLGGAWFVCAFLVVHARFGSAKGFFWPRA